MQNKILIIFIVLLSSVLFSESSSLLYKKNSPATVRIDAFVPDNVIRNDGGCGTGFIIDPMGVIVTNHHVIDGAKSISVELESGVKYEVQGFYYIDERLDIAIMKIPAFGLPYVKLGNSNYIEELEEIFTIGNPLCGSDEYSKNTASIGNISQRYTDDEGIDWIKHTAPISSGNSGGPLLNMSGEVIGVNTRVWTGDAQNLNLAIPINYVRGYVESGLLNVNIPVDYDYVTDSWDRYYSEQLKNCNERDFSEEQCECVFNMKKENFEHWHYVELTDNFIEIVNEKCFNNSKDNSISNEYGCIKGNCYDEWSLFVYGPGDFEGDMYEGQYKNGDRHGYGTYIWGGEWLGQTYRGEFSNWKNHGYGIFTYRSGDVETGIFKDGELTTELSLNDVEEYLSNKYDIKYINNTLDEWDNLKNLFIEDCSKDKSIDYCKKFWKCSYPYLINKYKTIENIDWEDQAYFDLINNECDESSNIKTNGCISGNCIDGQGVEVNAYGKFTGQFKNGSMFSGLLEYDNGSYYKGEFKDGAYKIGWGTFGWPDGNKYIGYFVPWKGRTGQGSFIFSSGIEIFGEFSNGSVNEGYNLGIKDNSKFTVTWPDGLKYLGNWSNSKTKHLSIDDLEKYINNFYPKYSNSNNFNEEDYKLYFDNNYEYLDKIEGIWEVSFSVINPSGVIVETNENFASAIIVKSESNEYDFYEYIGNNSNMDWTPGAIGAFFNKTNNPYIYKSFQLDQNGNKTHDIMRDYRLFDDELFFKEILNDEGFNGIHLYKKIYPLK